MPEDGGCQALSAERLPRICFECTDLPFGPEGARPVCPNGTRLQMYTLFHAHELDRWMGKYREQVDRDSEEATVRKLEQERPTRMAIREAIMDRNRHLDPMNRDLNLRSLELMDVLYERSIARRRKVETFLAAEAYDASKSSVDVGLESPAFQPRRGDL